MKPTIFYWQWEGREQRPDPSMTRARAARLLRAWRAEARRQPPAHIVACKRLRQGVYRVATRDLSAYLIIRKMKS